MRLSRPAHWLAAIGLLGSGPALAVATFDGELELTLSLSSLSEPDTASIVSNWFPNQSAGASGDASATAQGTASPEVIFFFDPAVPMAAGDSLSQTVAPGDLTGRAASSAADPSSEATASILGSGAVVIDASGSVSDVNVEFDLDWSWLAAIARSNALEDAAISVQLGYAVSDDLTGQVVDSASIVDRTFAFALGSLSESDNGSGLTDIDFSVPAGGIYALDVSAGLVNASANSSFAAPLPPSAYLVGAGLLAGWLGRRSTRPRP